MRAGGGYDPGVHASTVTCAAIESMHDRVMSTHAALPDPDKCAIPRDLESIRFLMRFLEGGFLRCPGYAD